MDSGKFHTTGTAHLGWSEEAWLRCLPSRTFAVASDRTLTFYLEWAEPYKAFIADGSEGKRRKGCFRKGVRRNAMERRQLHVIRLTSDMRGVKGVKRREEGGGVVTGYWVARREKSRY